VLNSLDALLSLFPLYIDYTANQTWMQSDLCVDGWLEQLWHSGNGDISPESESRSKCMQS